MRYDVVRGSDLPVPNEMRGPACIAAAGRRVGLVHYPDGRRAGVGRSAVESKRTVVTSGWRYWRHMRSARHPAVLVLTLACVVAAGGVATALSVPPLAGVGGSGPGGDVPRQLALLLGVPWMVLGAVALPLLVRAVPDLVRRRVVEGRVVRVRTPLGRRSWTSGDERMERFDRLSWPSTTAGAATSWPTRWAVCGPGACPRPPSTRWPPATTPGSR